jgi:hypothetical protein
MAGPHLDRNGHGSQYDGVLVEFPEDVPQSQDDREAGTRIDPEAEERWIVGAE